MTKEQILKRLDDTGIHREDDSAVPINGAQVRLPYQVVRTKETFSGSDNGRVQVLRIEWVVALFTTDADMALESKIAKALCGTGRVEVIHYPDGRPYQTSFKFTTNQIMR